MLFHLYYDTVGHVSTELLFHVSPVIILLNIIMLLRLPCLLAFHLIKV